MLKLYKPEYPELDYRQNLLADERTMSYNQKWGGTIDFSQEKWAAWYKRWVLADEKERYYRYLYAEDAGCFVGEAAYHYDESHQVHMISIIIHAERRNQGYGKAGLSLLLDAARQNGIGRLCDNIAIDNPAIALFLRMGFTEISRNDDSILVEIYI